MIKTVIVGPRFDQKFILALVALVVIIAVLTAPEPRLADCRPFIYSSELDGCVLRPRIAVIHKTH